jgi:DNA-binding GntR family transcriptional regulator
MSINANIDKPNKKTLAEQTYEILYNGIINGEFRTGDELVEQQLAKILQVSRTPIREALKRLKAMDLVEGSSYSKMTVKKITPEEIDEVTDIRTLLEIYTMEKAVDHCTPEDIRALETILEKTREQIMAGNLIEVISLNTQFHETLIGISGKKMAIQMLNSLRDILNRHRIAGLASGYSWRNYEAHLRLVDALRRKDKVSAVEEIRRHMQESRQSSLEGLAAEMNQNLK